MDRMSRVSLFTLFAALLPVVAAAQVAPPPPPAPAPPAMPAPMAPPAPPAPVAIYVPPVMIDTEAIQGAVEAARAASMNTDAIREQARAIADQAREQARQATENMRMVRPALAPMAFAYEQQDFSNFRMGSTDSNYSQGLSSLTQHQYEAAITRFDRVIAAKSTHADGALYYKAWALSKLGRSEEAVAALAELKKSYSSSPYLNEGRTLEANVKKLGPDQVDDDDLKLLAIQALQYSDPDKAMSTCEMVLNGTNSLAVKRRAIYSLALIDRPEAHQLLLSYAKGKGNPELQREAINYLGARSAKQPTKSAELIDIYNSTPDLDVKMAVISAFRSAGDKSSLMTIASGQGFGVGVGRGGTPTPMAMAQVDQMNLRSRAINNLSDVASPQELWPLYAKEENKDLRGEWVATFSSMGAIDQLVQIVKTEKDPTVRSRAIRALGNQKGDKTGTLLTDLYTGGDKDTKEAVIQALGNQSNAEGLIAIARKENDKDLKVKVARQLVELAPRSKAAADYLVEILK
jgi:HEAT repeat protein